MTESTLIQTAGKDADVGVRTFTIELLADHPTDAVNTALGTRAVGEHATLFKLTLDIH